MIERILSFSLTHRYLVVLLVAAASAFGLYSLQNLPIDAVPALAVRNREECYVPN